MAHALLRLVFAPPLSGGDGGRGHIRSTPGARESEKEFPSQERTDRELLERIRAGDPIAFETLFRAEYAALHDFAVAWCGVPAQAEEIVSDVFLWLYEHRATVAPHTSLAAYLMGMVRHRALNARRSVDRAMGRHQALAAEAHESVVPQPIPTPEEVWLDREAYTRNVQRLARALAPLSQMARSVFLLRAQRDMSYAEVAEVLGISANAAKTQFSRTLAAVRRALGAEPEG